MRAPKRAATTLGKRADVRYVEENGRMETFAQTLQWSVDRVDADRTSADGTGADIAIVDTGIDSDRSDLEQNLGEGVAVVPCSDESYCNGCKVPWDDDSGHGTQLATLVGAVDNYEGTVGVAPGATLHAVKVFGADGSGSYSDIAAGLETVADKGWDVANMSFGGSYSSTLYDAIRYADDEGVTLVGAVGNSGSCTDCVSYPAKFGEVIAVSATNRNDSLAYFSATGPEVELAAPGTDIYFESCDASDGYQSLSGTSYAAAHVSGGAGILRAQGYTSDGARTRLRDTAEDLGLSSNEQGYGLLDVAAAA
ncbi:S8 family serine peptidase [Halorussus caseinilyticus]|uniref:S8 family serine peptidase n=2 Tax=Halorussus caseinilyticus TaxID=3034025 RepID=A0ABD5WLR5_9EURY